MDRQRRLLSLKFASGLRESLGELSPYTKTRFGKDLIAGITVGIIAIPLAMALAIASGVAPQYGLYTAAFAGIIIAISGGSRYSVSGPTAAFVVILHPAADEYGLAGLLVAGLLAGVMLIGMAVMRLGRLIEYIPEAVTLGFTGGIAVVIATLQIENLLGLTLIDVPEFYLAKVLAIIGGFSTLSWGDTAVGLSTLITLIIWPKLKLRIPGHLPAVLIGIGVSLSLTATGHSIATIGSEFSYLLADGTVGHGIPASFPDFVLPWNLPGKDGLAMVWNLETIEGLIGVAFSIAMLGAIESLLCAVVLDGMTNTRHHANGELLGQGIGNIIVPFFGGITATAAIARSTANYRAGAQSPISAVIHSLVVLAGIVLLAPLLAYLPMASMAALLLLVAWHMSEFPKAMHLIKRAPSGDILVFLTCFSLTVLLDMVIAISAGIVLASLLFMGEIAKMTVAKDIRDNHKHVPMPVPEDWSVYKVNGPLFFAAADRLFSQLSALTAAQKGILLYLDGVEILDGGGLSALEKFLQLTASRNQSVILADMQSQPAKALKRAINNAHYPHVRFSATLAEALQHLTVTTEYS